MQSVRASLIAAEDEFAGHCKHTDPAVALRYAPAAQSEQSPVPLKALYLPIAHAVQTMPSDAPSYPISQMQSVMSELPAGESVKVGQLMQTDPPLALR